MDNFNKNNDDRTPEQDPFNQPTGGLYKQRDIPQQGQVPPQQIPPQYDPRYNPQYNPQSHYQQYVPYQQEPSIGMAVASLVLGIVSIVFSYFIAALPVLYVLPIIGIILGVLFKKKNMPAGKGLANAGIITSAVAIGLTIIFYLFAIYIIQNYMPEIMAYMKQVSPEDYQLFYDMFAEYYPEWFEGLIRFIRK